MSAGNRRRLSPHRRVAVGAVRSVTYRLYPTARQALALDELLEVQRQLYNAALEERRGAWAWERRAVSRYDQYNGLTGADEWCPELARFGRRVAQGTLDRLDEAFGHFYRRVRDGGKPGFPRFKGRSRWDSVQWSNAGGSWKLAPTGKGTYGRLYLQGVGHISVKLHRRFGGAQPVKLVVRRRTRGWEATVVYRGVPVEPLPATGRAAGVDVGITVLAAGVDDQGAVELVANPAPLTRALRRLETAQQALAACKQGSNRRRRARRRVGRIHEQVRHVRRDHAHQVSKRLVDDYDLIAVEDLHITAMTRSARGTLETPGTNVAAKAGLNRSILDAGWGQLVRMLTYKPVGNSCGSQHPTPHRPALTAARPTRPAASTGTGSPAPPAATPPTPTPTPPKSSSPSPSGASPSPTHAAHQIVHGPGRATATQPELRIVK